MGVVKKRREKAGSNNCPLICHHCLSRLPPLSPSFATIIFDQRAFNRHIWVFLKRSHRDSFDTRCSFGQTKQEVVMVVSRNPLSSYLTGTFLL